MVTPATAVLRIYLDTCCLQRPFDDQTQPRIRVETEAVLAILAAVQAGEVEMVNSEALEYEIDRIPDEQRCYEALALLSLAAERLVISEAVEQMAEFLETKGIQPMDAIHLALASSHRLDHFVTTDDALLRKARYVHLNVGQCPFLNYYRSSIHERQAGTHARTE